jgi:uncharacterized membrane protein YsdA (DUF1294 family)
MYTDKEKAKKRKWRIPEKTLWGAAFCGGAVGSTLGMRMFKHKNKKISFKVGLPILAVIQIGLVWLVFFN